MHGLPADRGIQSYVVSLPAGGEGDPIQMESLAAVKEPEVEEVAKDTFVAFARVYSGVVRRGQKVFILGPKYDPAQGLNMVIFKPSHTPTHIAAPKSDSLTHALTRTHCCLTPLFNVHPPCLT